MIWAPPAAFVSAILLNPIMMLAGLLSALPPENPAAGSRTPVAPDQIVARIEQHDAEQSRALQHYESTRHYQVRYKGFKTQIMAAMDVDARFDSVSGKSFRILSQSGSKLLCDKVLKRAVESEQEASKDRASTALNSTNYRFELEGEDQVDGRPAYVLRVDPVKKSKFLYRGKIWVDAADYAVARIEAEPAINPSFFIAGTRIEHRNTETRGVWLPQQNRSESKIRVGGTAVMTIDYGTYTVVVAAHR